MSQSSSSEIGSNSTGSQGDVLVVGDDVPVPLSEKLLGGKAQALANSNDEAFTVKTIVEGIQEQNKLLRTLIEKADMQNDLLTKVYAALDKDSKAAPERFLGRMKYMRKDRTVLLKRYVYPTEDQFKDMVSRFVDFAEKPNPSTPWSEVEAKFSTSEERVWAEVLKKLKDDVRRARSKLATKIYRALVEGTVDFRGRQRPLFEEVEEDTPGQTRLVNRYKLTDIGRIWKQDNMWRVSAEGDPLTGEIFTYLASKVDGKYWVQCGDGKERLPQAVVAFMLMICEMGFEEERLGDVRSETEKMRRFRQQLAYCNEIQSEILSSFSDEQQEGLNRKYDDNGSSEEQTRDCYELDDASEVSMPF